MLLGVSAPGHGRPQGRRLALETFLLTGAFHCSWNDILACPGNQYQYITEHCWLKGLDSSNVSLTRLKAGGSLHQPISCLVQASFLSGPQLTLPQCVHTSYKATDPQWVVQLSQFTLQDQPLALRNPRSRLDRLRQEQMEEGGRGPGIGHCIADARIAFALVCSWLELLPVNL